MYERLKHEGMVQNHKLKQMYFCVSIQSNLFHADIRISINYSIFENELILFFILIMTKISMLVSIF